jgi:hypothetical protein
VVVRACIAAAVVALLGAEVRAEPSSSCTSRDVELDRAAPTFTPGHASLTDAGKLALQPIAAVLHARPRWRIAVTGHFTADLAPNPEPIAWRRAEVVKWYLVDSGVEADRIDTGVSSVVLPDRAVEVQVASEQAACRLSKVATSGVTSTRVTTEPAVDSARPSIVLATLRFDLGDLGREGSHPVGVDLTQLVASAHSHDVTVGSHDTSAGFRTSTPSHNEVAPVTKPAPPPPVVLAPAPPRTDETVHRVTVTPPRIAPPVPAPDEIVTRINTSYMPALSHCSRTAQRDNPALWGRVKLTFAVDQDGVLTDVNAQGPDDDLDRCITTLMSHWRFAVPSASDATQLFSMSVALQGH